MNPFGYVLAESPSAALTEIANDRGARFIAGGTNILDLMKDAVETPSTLIDINALPLADIERGDRELRIGALARMSDVARHSDVRALFPMVAIALDESASPQLRNMGTMGGNLLQRTRCAYFRDVATPCNKRAPGSGCGALRGVNRTEAVLGTSEACIAAHASDVAVAFVALDSVVHTLGTGGSRAIPLAEFYRTPGQTPQIENALQPGEMIVAVSIPIVPWAKSSTYVKVRDRAQYEFALASAAVALDIDGGIVRNARVALGGIATIPWRSHAAEAELVRKPATNVTFERAAEAALSDAHGYAQNAFKIPLAKRTLVRALETVSA
ncbi:MAG TPA: xanthine dehydrogenase family protein subunit M [Candidatus Baltobacteraceae bacterium]|jgi:xanthine dehydrogenase YagS FAD-binding subunit|nr:xanthine dehydrogenase family protein subunit M [Candidatus Baltobacteraceae bacterium]